LYIKNQAIRSSSLSCGIITVDARRNCEFRFGAPQKKLYLSPMSEFQIRLATVADVELISWHRARMFQDMGELPPELFETFRVQSRDKLHRMFERGEYVGWLASAENEPERIVAGAGVQLREVPPHPVASANGKIDIASGRQAIIQNVFTEPDCRRRGLAALLIERIIDWTGQEGIDSLVLHASDEGRALYERLGFIATSEMRFNGF
jgi:GNAT superfamily N-acetyltransferase